MKRPRTEDASGEEYFQTHRRITDRDLPEADRVLGNMWRIRYLEMYREVIKANKGIRRLKKALDNHRGKKQ